jgi:hypothetical protein
MSKVIIWIAIVIVIIVGAVYFSSQVPQQDSNQIDITPQVPASVSPTQENSCDSSYPDVCIAVYPPDLDCGEIGYSNFRVTGSDRHGFDGDNDGIGCEVGSIPSPAPTTQENNCDSSYPDVCIAVYPPDLDCGEIGFSNFRVTGSDPHGFDGDNDGIGCEVGSPEFSNPVVSSPSSNSEEFTLNCDSSYPDVCIAVYPPDLDCGEIGFSNFRVTGSDPHGFDGDNDGIGCESSSYKPTTQSPLQDCSGNARCITGIVTKVIDGDTIKVGEESIRFALTSAPELNEAGGSEAKDFINSICPVGSTVTVDEDDGQTQGTWDRIIGVIYCNGLNLNEELMSNNHGYILSEHCDASEFSSHAWIQKYGC